MIDIENLDWTSVRENLHQRGYAQLRQLLNAQECDDLIEQYENPVHYRKTIVMERYRFGSGEYKYFSYPLPSIIRQIRENVYPRLVPVANQWMHVLNQKQSYPARFQDFQDLCHAAGQTKPTVLILKYGQGGHNTLHQDLYGELFFPIQMVLFLNEPDRDYTGGEFVITEQIPRAQSKAIVLKPRKGDALLFTTNFRPVKGTKGYYRVNMKHGVSEVHHGRRYTLGIIFHDALS
ncbi:2OG-Fe(II) oxygenase [Dyadobacter sp. 676]|uniref:2OG-Fe(II) oxygenase n=1 Tax=Dyadobacter sp. 676 TaxID=3088362 RepID=A0AAU8FK12_9BACT